MPSRPRKPALVECAPVWFTVAEAATYLGLSERQVRLRIAERKIAVVHDGQLRMTKADLDDYIARHRISALAPAVSRPSGDEAIADLMPKVRRLS